MSSFSINVIAALIIVFTCCLLNRSRRYRRVTDIRSALEILNNSSFQSRANANVHLRDAFGIMNPFVNGDKLFHDEYVKHVHRRLSGVTRDWSGIVSCTVEHVKQLPPLNSIEDIRDAIRGTVMCVALYILDVEANASGELSQVGNLINLIWLSAKNGGETLKHRNKLFAVLRRWKANGFINKLAKISNVSKERAILSVMIPAYETMYRVVLPLIFHTRNIISFDQFLLPNVSTTELDAITEKGYSYLALIKETLRMYPVVKRIKRATFWRTEAVDIEAIHLDYQGWVDADKFEPARWMKTDKGGFIPFGAGRGRCIANERIVGMIVCIVLAAVEEPLREFKGGNLNELLLNDREKQLM